MNLLKFILLHNLTESEIKKRKVKKKANISLALVKQITKIKNWIKDQIMFII